MMRRLWSPGGRAILMTLATVAFIGLIASGVEVIDMFLAISLTVLVWMMALAGLGAEARIRSLERKVKELESGT